MADQEPKLGESTVTPSIDKDLQLSPIYKGHIKYPFERMEIGDSFYVEASRSVVKPAAYKWAKTKGGGWRFAVRPEGTGTRLWRVDPNAQINVPGKDAPSLPPIEKGVPIPQQTGAYRKYPFDEMEVGDSFFVAAGKNILQMAINKWSKARKRNWVFRIEPEVEVEVEGVRVWRVE